MTNNNDIKVLTARFFADPEWKQVEEMILAHIEPFKDLDSIDTSQPGEHVKAEIIARKLSYNALTKFLADTKLVNRPFKPYKNPWT
jgi:hypothetical protein